MAIPSLPWYPQLKKIVAPTEGITNLVLIGIIVACLIILWKGSPVAKAAFVVYMVSP